MTEQELIAKFYESIKEPNYPEKSYGWLLSQLPSPIAEKAIANVIEQHGTQYLHKINPHVYTPKFAVNSSFVWDGTKEGKSYWGKIFTEL